MTKLGLYKQNQTVIVYYLVNVVSRLLPHPSETLIEGGKNVLHTILYPLSNNQANTMKML